MSASLLVVALAILPDLSVFRQDPVAIEAKPVRVLETRMRDLRSAPQPGIESESSRCEILCELRAPWLAEATRWGQLTLQARTDDGASLVAAKRVFGPTSTDLQAIDRHAMFFGEETIPSDVLHVDLPLALPARSATKIVTLVGNMTIEVGRPKEVVVDALKTQVGKVLDDPTLRAIGTRATLTSLRETELVLQLHGGLDGILEVDVADAAGKTLVQGRGWSGFNDDREYTFQFESPLPETARLVIRTNAGTTRRRVTFAVRDVVLP